VRERGTKKPAKQSITDPGLAAAARELRDRWLEQINGTAYPSQGKYEVGSLIEAKPARVKLLAA
jgi:hypothetical protein